MRKLLFALIISAFLGCFCVLALEDFSDVSKSDWFYDAVFFCREKKLVNGYSDGRFLPNGNITAAESVALCARLHALLSDKTIAAATAGPWYEAYYTYARENSVIPEDFKKAPDEAATREEFSLMLYNSIGSNLRKEINPLAVIPDYPQNGKNYKYILKLYKAGILYGGDAGRFNGNDNIKRSEVSTLLFRVLSPDKRAQVKSVVINEILTDNVNIISDYSGDFCDYIELFNPTENNIDLTGYSLCDKNGEDSKSVLNSIKIEAGGRLLIFASGKNSVYGEPHIGFKLSANGDTVSLYDPNGKLCDYMSIPFLYPDTAYGCKTDAEKDYAMLKPTPNKANNMSALSDAEISLLKTPVFSRESGFYNNEFYLKIQADFGHTVYYTLNGTQPDKSSIRYTDSIRIYDVSVNSNVYAMKDDVVHSEKPYKPSFNIDKATVVRAVSYDAAGNRGREKCATYFIGYGEKEAYNGISVMSIVTDPTNLFDYEKGIYVRGKLWRDWCEKNPDSDKKTHFGTPVNYNQRGKEWERPANIEFFENDRSLVLSQGVGIRIRGNASRSFIQKSFSLFARTEYDKNDRIDYKFFENRPKLDKILLRNGGNDFSKLKLRDPINQLLVADRDLSYQSFRPCAVFLDGEYWGLYSIREGFNDDYVKQHYDVKKSNVVMIKNGAVEEGEKADGKLYTDMIAFFKTNDMSKAENYEAANKMLDMQSFIDYYAAETYLANQDWPHNNFALWRARTKGKGEYEDGRWRWMMFDSELSTSLDNSTTVPDFDTVALKAMNGPIFASLINNPDFRRDFAITYMDLMNYNFNYNRVYKIIDSYVKLYMPQALHSANRFFSMSFDETRYLNYAVEYKSFFKNRPNFAPDFLAAKFSLSGKLSEITVTASDNSAGTLSLNTLKGLSFDSVKNYKYFIEYPIELTAVPKEGHRFVGWEGYGLDIRNPAAETICFTPTKANYEIRAIFE